jgi:hypothetical protein
MLKRNSRVFYTQIAKNCSGNELSQSSKDKPIETLQYFLTHGSLAMDLLTSDTNVTTELSTKAMNSRRVSLASKMKIILKSAITSTALKTSGFWQKLGLRGLEEFTNLFQTLPQRM